MKRKVLRKGANNFSITKWDWTKRN